MRIKSLRAALLACLAIAAPSVASAEEATIIDQCKADQCVATLTARDLLATADKLVSAHRFAEAAPLLTALENAPEFAMERQFLLGYSAIETGDVDGAIRLFRNVLEQHPDQTRVRLELARALQIKGKTGSADYHYRLAQNDKNLPVQVASMVKASRGLLRDMRPWSFSLDFGLAPDTNITNGTSADSIDVNFGGLQIPLTLGGNSRKTSGIGQSLGISAGYRMALGEETRLLIEADATGMNYKGQDYDDLSVQLAAGPEFALSDEARLSVQALGSQRWYGGKMATQALGARATFQHNLAKGQRIGLSLDARNANSGFSPGYDGWQLGAYASYETVLSRSLMASATLFGRKDMLQSKPFSGTEVGANLGLGGELPLGINAGVSGGVSQQSYDAAQLFFSSEARKDVRLNARVQLGLRSVRMLGFSPSVTYSFSKSQSNITLYDFDRHRLRFGLAKYF